MRGGGQHLQKCKHSHYGCGKSDFPPYLHTLKRSVFKALITGHFRCDYRCHLIWKLLWMPLKCQICPASLLELQHQQQKSRCHHHIVGATELLTFGMLQPPDYFCLESAELWDQVSGQVTASPFLSALHPSPAQHWRPPHLPVILLPAEWQLCQLVGREGRLSESSHICCFTGSLRSAPGISL